MSRHLHSKQFTLSTACLVILKLWIEKVEVTKGSQSAS
jgi:hypothetical protein